MDYAEKAAFAEGKLNRANWFIANGLRMTEELNKLLGRFTVLGTYDATRDNTNVVPTVPPFIANLPKSPYASDWGRPWSHTTND